MCGLTSSRSMEGLKHQLNDPTCGKETPPDLEEREPDSFRTLTWLYTPYILAGEATLSGRKSAGARICQTRTLTSSFLSVVCVPCWVQGISLGIPVEME